MPTPQNLAIDENMRNALGAVTNDSNEFIERLRVNPVTGALVCEATITSSNTSIGSTIPGGTEGSVLFIGLGSTLAQDNTEFFWDDTNHFLGLGTNTPAATLDVEGTTILNDGSAVVGYVFTATDTLGTGTWMPSGGGGGGGTVTSITGFDSVVTSPGTITTTGTIALVNDTATPGNSKFYGTNSSGVRGWFSLPSGGGITSINADTTAAQLLTNTDTFIDITQPVAGTNRFAINIGNLTSDATFITDIANSLLADNTFTTDLANNSNFITTLANNTTFISDLTSNSTFQSDIVTIINTDPSISIDLTSQVTGILPVVNGGTGDSSFTPYAVIAGGTTSTAPLQSLAGLGSLGDILTSNGAGALPTFQTFSGNVGSTNGVSTYPGSGVQTITHGLGRTPVNIRLTGYGTSAGTSRFSASTGVYSGGAQSCVYHDGSLVGGSPVISTALAIYLEEIGVGAATGVIQNITSTTFDIDWTQPSSPPSGTAFIWETQ